VDWQLCSSSTFLNHSDHRMLTLSSHRARNSAKNRVVLSVLDRDLGLGVLLKLLLLLMQGVLKLPHLLHDLLIKVLLRLQLVFEELQAPFDLLPLGVAH